MFTPRYPLPRPCFFAVCMLGLGKIDFESKTNYLKEFEFNFIGFDLTFNQITNYIALTLIT